jgi:citronellol/citronellal dehydrogenase
MTPHSSAVTDRTLVISGGSRGIGLAIGIAAARRGANVVLLAKTDMPHPKLPGTVHTAAAEIEAAGGKGAAVVGDVRNEDDVRRAVDTAVERFGGIDICVNNASAIATDPTEQLSVKKYDLMSDINIKGTFLLTQACVPHLRNAENPHVLTISPPLNMNPRWLGAHPVYTLSKYGMSLLSLGWAAEFAHAGIAFNCLWPRTYIATAAVANSPDGENMIASSRSPEIMGDAAVEIVVRPSREATAGCYIDEEVLVSAGGYDLSRYGGGSQPIGDLFIG